MVFSVFVSSSIYYYAHTIINDGLLYDINSSRIVYQVENIEINNNTLFLSVWCCCLDADLSQESNIPNMRIILIPTSDYKTFHYFNAEYGIARPEVDAYYREENELTHCGFDANIDLSKLDINDQTYEIVLQPNDRKTDLIRPGIFIYQGDISPAEGEFIKTNVVGTDLEEIVENGFLRAYIFQYDWKIYFIAEENYRFDEDQMVYGFNVSTNHPELLSYDRQEYAFEALGWNLLDSEITEIIDSGNYRVFVHSIPSEYPVKLLDTGIWSAQNGWVTRYRICPGIPER